VQVMSAVGAMQAAGHNQPHSTGRIVPALAKNARAGHPQFWRLKERIVSDDVLGWIGVAVALIAAIVLDKGSAPHKWHAAIMWTAVAFLCVLKFGQKKWNSWLFWTFCSTCLILHVLAMWLIFEQLLPRLILGTLYVVPIAFIEAIFLVGMFAKLERMLGADHSAHSTQE
jgi:hypothetical protein